ncbi:MAG: ribosomal protein S18-alanine N-acetyltransferase [Anaerolineales bacterium]|nr:ribosomal protein S18-alanine N-acetyltransferase [Anaerolineales bacterium]
MRTSPLVPGAAGERGAAIAIAPMTLDDIPQVLQIDRLSFPQPWSEQSYRFELLENQHAYFIVAAARAAGPTARRWWERLAPRRPMPRQVVGYAGLWLVVDEAHINTLAVHPEWRGHGIGEQLLVALLAHARAHQALTATLEVRVRNLTAQHLYRKYGFEEVGRRPRYYRDGEDALLMTTHL